MQEMENRIPLVPGLGPGGHSDRTLTRSGLHVVHTLHPKQLLLGRIPTKTHREAAFAETYSDLINPKLRESEALEQDGHPEEQQGPAGNVGGSLCKPPARAVEPQVPTAALETSCISIQFAGPPGLAHPPELPFPRLGSWRAGLG